MLNKIKWVFGIALIFILILTTNLIDRRNFRTVKESIVSIYENHLVTKDMVLELSNSMNEKAVAVALCDSAFFAGRNQAINIRIGELIQELRGTKLTNEAISVLDRFEIDFEKLKTSEQNLPTDSKALSKKLQEHKIANELSDLGMDLKKLASIQLQEGRREAFVGKQAVEAVELLTKMEIYILLGLALIVQFAILYTPKRKREEEGEI